MSAELNELAERVEQISPEEAERTELGVEINEALGIASYITDAGDPTQSIDAAMTLIDDGAGVYLERMFEKDGARWDAAIYIGAGPVHRFYANRAHSAALALTAAALRSKAASE